MATWTKIEDGMKQGGTAIQAALEAVNTDATTGAQATKVYRASATVPATSFSDAGTLYFERIGNLVMCFGILSFSASAQWKTVLQGASFPNGFKYHDAPQASSIWGSISYSGQFAYLYINDAGLQVITSGTSVGQVEGSLAYFTTDDFPD